MTVTDTDGYIMLTDISYDKKKNLIVISPLDTYEQNVFYILSVSKKVMSAQGQHLKSAIHILFKLMGGQISEFQVLKSTAKIPPPKKRPANYEQLRASKSKMYSFQESSKAKETPQDQVMFGTISINIFVPFIGILAMVGGAVTQIQMFLMAGIVVFFACLLFFVYQLTRDVPMSQVCYNIGALHFNRGNYKKAKKYFKYAADKNSENELAEYALNKVEFYI
jgi:TPR repeat protein